MIRYQIKAVDKTNKRDYVVFEYGDCPLRTNGGGCLIGTPGICNQGEYNSGSEGSRWGPPQNCRLNKYIVSVSISEVEEETG